MGELNQLAEIMHRLACDHGFFDEDFVRDFDGMIANVHGECSEALFEWRNGHDFTEVYYNEDKPTKPEGIPIELADIIIRVLDMCMYYGIDIEKAIETKFQYNVTRPHRHGGKRS